MELTIGGKVREIKFNMKFVRKMDEFYKVNRDGVEMGMGVSMGYNNLLLYSITDLAKAIRCAADGAPNVLDVDKCIEDYAEEHGDLNPLFDDFKEEMGKSPLLKATIKGFEKLARENQK